MELPLPLKPSVHRPPGFRSAAEVKRELDRERPSAARRGYARNPRTHSDAQIAQIAASIREFGWTNPVLIDGESGIIAGHGRVLAARKLGLVQVVELDPGYCDVILERWQDWTGEVATLEDGGRSFEEIESAGDAA